MVRATDAVGAIVSATFYVNIVAGGGGGTTTYTISGWVYESGSDIQIPGARVVVTDHNVRETLGLTDRAYIIYSGEVLMEGRTEDIVNNPDVRRLYLGEEFRL